jgi:transcriptional regulator with PAS, ATPase and Fis domain
MLNLLLKCEKIASSDLFVIIEGETGTGKELLAKFIHCKSKRRAGNFVALNCAAIPENLMEDELFGHEKGAFTDARNLRIGKLELSSGGTLILDEIGDMPLSLQKKLLRVIQEGHFSRLGGNQLIRIDLRIICLTHKNIKELLLKKELRQDLYYRIAHVTLSIPPLKERKEDIVPLVNHFVKIFSIKNQINIRGASKEVINALEMYHWPGNIRELENEIKKMIAISESGDMIDVDSLKDEIITFYKEHGPITLESGESEKKRILMLMEKHKWNKTRVAKELNISRTALYEKLKKYKL